jgi:hypothetical protein
LLNASDLLKKDTNQLSKLLKLMLPKKGSNVEQVSFYENYTKFNLDRRTVTTPGRFFRRVFPDAADQLVEAFASWWQTTIVFDVEDYILHVGDTKEDFRNAFRKYCRTIGSFDYNGAASISDSCMRYSFDNLSDHPSVVYASGDFKVATIKRKDGKVRARVLIGYKNGVAFSNRIYASCNYSKGLLIDYLKNIKAQDAFYGDEWSGLRLLKIQSGAVRSNCTPYLCPYIDNYRYVSINDENTLVITPRASSNYESNSTCGYLSFYEADDQSKWYRDGVKKEPKATVMKSKKVSIEPVWFWGNELAYQPTISGRELNDF